MSMDEKDKMDEGEKRRCGLGDGEEEEEEHQRSWPELDMVILAKPVV